VVQQPLSDKQIISREDGAFAPAIVRAGGQSGGEVVARLRRTSSEGPVLTDKRAWLKSGADVVDTLSVVYYLRSRELVEGTPFCFELYHRRKLWRVTGTVAGREVVRAPGGAHVAQRLEAELRPVVGKNPPRPVTAWISADDDRVPVLVKTPDGVGSIEVRLLSHQRGRRLVGK
jgi:hypothetical protein